MKPEELFQKLLGLGNGWEIGESSYVEAENRFILRVREKAPLWEGERCPHDGEAGITCYDHVAEMRWRHLNVFNKACDLVCALPRGRCPRCGKVYRITPPWEGRSGNFTTEFEAFALTLMKQMPVKNAAEIMGETDTRMWRILLKHVDDAHDKLGMEEVTCVGVDETSRARGHQYVTVFCDLRSRRVVYATPGKDSSTWEEFAKALLAHNGHPHALTHVSMDMSAAYVKGVAENCRNAKVVFDKFHLMQYAGKAVDQVRRREVRAGDESQRKALFRSRWLWLKNPDNLTDKEKTRMERIDLHMLDTAKAYQMRLVLQRIYQSQTAKTAADRLGRWCRWVRRLVARKPGNPLAAMLKVAKLIEKYSAGILAHWDGHLTNAYLEGLNSVFSAVKRRARGYRTSRYLIAMLYFVAGKLPDPKPLFH